MSTPNIPFFNMEKKNTLNHPKSAAMGFFSKGLTNVFERAVVNEPSVFEALKFYCFLLLMLDFCIKTRTLLSLRDKRLFELIKVEITRVGSILALLEHTL